MDAGPPSPRAPRGAFSANTERAARADIRVFAAWCGECGRVPMPAGSETVAAFVDAMAATRAPATVRRYVASIAAAHRSVDRGEAARSAPVKLALKRMHRRQGTPAGTGARPDPAAAWCG